MKPLKLKASHAILDVETGRRRLFKRVGPPMTRTRVGVTITGFIDYAWGQDDGVSREFHVTVTDVVVEDARESAELAEKIATEGLRG